MAIATQMVTDAGLFRVLLAAARNTAVKGVDCEADVAVIKKPNGKRAIDARTFDVVGGSLYVAGEDTAYYMPFGHKHGANLPAGCREEWLQFLASEFLDAARRLTGPRTWVHNQNAEVQMLANHGYLVESDEPHGAWDSMIAAWLLGYGGDRDEEDGGGSFEALGLKDLRVRVLNLGARREFNDIANGRQASEIPSHDMAEYAALDAYDACMVGESLFPRLQRAGVVEHMRTIDQPMAEICRGMEAEGWDIDQDSIRELDVRLRSEARALAQRFAERTTVLTIDVEDVSTEIGEYKNGKPKFKKLPTQIVRVRGGDVSNDRDCARFIFDETRALPRRGATINKDGTPSLKRENIERYLASHADKLGAELVQLRFDYKMRSTITNNFVKPLTTMPDQYGDGRIHSVFKVTGTATQRLSSSNPNTQNLPSRTEMGKVIRAAFRAPDGWRVGCFDMSQAELRVAAHLSRDPELMRCYAGVTPEDVHAGTLALLHELGWTTATRVDAKTCNFASLYNITAPKLAIKMKCSVERATIALQAFRTRFAGYMDFVEWCYEFVREHGYMKTLDGFKRPLDNTLHWDKFARKNDLHWTVRNQCANTAIQGSVAGIAKIAMIGAKREFLREGLWGSHVRFRAQEHDSCIVVARDECTVQVEEIIRRHMTTAIPLRVPMLVDGGWGASWGEAKQ